MLPSFRALCMGLTWVTGEASLRPYPSTSLPPVSSSNRCCTCGGSGADPLMQAWTLLKSTFALSARRLIATYIVGTPWKIVGRDFRMCGTTFSTSKRGMHTTAPPTITAESMTVVKA